MNTKQQLCRMFGEFFYLFGQEFFIKTKIGNFIWSNPSYNGDGSMRRYNGTLESYASESRCKGEHDIEYYCGDFTVVGE